MNITFGRKVQFDERSRGYPIRPLLAAARVPRSYTWKCTEYFDQGQEGACVGFSWAHDLVARPAVVRGINSGHAQQIYRVAQTLDEWPGTNYDGTSVIAGAKAVQKIYPKLMPEYRWAFGIEDVLLTLGYKGPVILGVDWFNNMVDPDENGIIRASGYVLGGHAILANGVNVKKKLVRLHNSWGPDWGLNGDCFISFDDLAKLLRRNGEACVPLSRAVG